MAKKATKPAPKAITMRATSAGPKGNHIAGVTYTIGTQISAEDAKELVDGHYASYVEGAVEREDEAEAAEAEPAETTAEAGGEETAAER